MKNPQEPRKLVRNAALIAAAVTLAAAALVACAGSKTKTDSVANPAPSKIKPFELPWPDESGDDVYDSGCTWVTLKGDAVVCFNSAQSLSGDPASITIHGIGATKNQSFELFVFTEDVQRNTDKKPDPRLLPPKGVESELMKSPEFDGARKWLASNPIIEAERRTPKAHAITPDRKAAIVVIDGLRLTTALPKLSKSYAPSDWKPVNVAQCCSFGLDKLIETPTGKQVAFYSQSCKVERADDCEEEDRQKCPPVGADECKTYVEWSDETMDHDEGALYVLKPFVGEVPTGTAFTYPTSQTAKALAPAAPTNTAALLNPSKAKLTAPAQFIVEFDTTAGKFQVSLTRAWAPNGVDRFYNLVQAGYFTDVAIFRAIRGFMFQFGIHGNPQVSAAWRPMHIADDPVQSAIASNTPGTLTFAKGGPNTRTTQLFINLGNNARLDAMGFPPIGRVVKGMGALQQVNTEYGEGAPSGKGPNQTQVQQSGNAFLRRDFPRLTYIKSVKLLK